MEKEVLEPTTLINFLQRLYPDSSNRKLKILLTNKAVFVDAIPCAFANKQLLPGQIVSVNARPKKTVDSVEILYEDKHILVVDKPAGLLSFPLEGKPVKNVFSILQKHFPSQTIYAVHRLDKDTAGVMVFAKTYPACTRLNADFRKNKITREYLALVEGIPAKSMGTWKWSLLEGKNLLVTAPIKGGKKAITHYQILKQYKSQALLKLHLDTGRKHQIRVHCKKAGNPIVGDTLYGTSKASVKPLCLHAEKIILTHPIHKKQLVVQSKIQNPNIKRKR